MSGISRKEVAQTGSEIIDRSKNSPRVGEFLGVVLFLFDKFPGGEFD